MSTHPILSRLESVRATGPDRWIARCPAHDDKSPSLSIRQDGERILLYCFTGCEVSAILAAVGLGWRDICPEREIPYQQALAAGHRRLRQSLADIDAKDYARWVLRIAASDLKSGRRPSLEDRATIAMAKELLQANPPLQGGRHP
jgi:hypothetical protein